MLRASPCFRRPLVPSRHALWLLAAGLLSVAPLAACGTDENEPGDEGRDRDDDEGQPGAKLDGGTPKKDAGRDAGNTSNTADTGTKPTPMPLDPDTCAAITKTAPVAKGKVDVIWLVDNSPSMFDKVVQLSANISNFFSVIQDSGADTRVITISLADLAAGTPLGMDAEKYRFVPSNVWSKLLYTTALSALPSFQDFLRPEASTHIVAVSDDDDLISAADFRAQMEMLLGHSFTLHAIVADQFGCGSAVGTQYMATADATSGEKISVCSQDWTQVFGDLQSAVIEAVPLPCSYDLAGVATGTDAYDPAKVAVVYTPDQSPDKQELPKSTGAGQCGDKQGWYYDSESAPTEITLCPAACELAKNGGAMDIAFGCKPTIFL